MTDRRTEGELGEALLAKPVRDDLAAQGRVAARIVRLEEFEPPLTLAKEERDAYLRRFSTLMVDDASARRGGIGCVMHGTNAWGEPIALKVLVPLDDSTAHLEGAAAEHERAFRQEYETQRRLMGLKGFPRLYGWGIVDGSPAIVMEWVEGVTLEGARRALAVDDEGRLSPLSAARIGRDLFDLIARMDVLDEGVAHRDVSPANVMVSTAHLPLLEQQEEGAFDLRLIDFGSAVPILLDASLTESAHRPRGATPGFAPPEMLTHDVAAAARLRKSAAVDVYAAASVTYLLAGARMPFDLEAVDADGEPMSPYRCKVECEPVPLVTAHGNAGSLPSTLLREPEVAVAIGHAVADMDAVPDAVQLRDALCMVDEELRDVLEACMDAEPARRPSAAQVRDALAAFCSQYASNIGRALRGEPLESCCTGALGHGLGRFSARTRTMLRVGGTVASAAIGASVMVSAIVLTAGAEVSCRWPGGLWEGPLPWWALLGLLGPAALGYALRWKPRRTPATLLRGSIGVAVGCVALLAALAALSLEPRAMRDLLGGAVLATSAAAWCPMALGYALPAVPLRPRRRLPAGQAVAREELPEAQERALEGAVDGEVSEGVVDD